jgi:hypothetical protein
MCLHILEWVGPRTVLRFSSTCRSYRALGRDAVLSVGYGQRLAKHAIRHFLSGLVSGHRDCARASPATLRATAESYVTHVVTTLAECSSDNPDKWELANLIKFLYPVAINLCGDWVMAPYALEWCARLENEVLYGVQNAPREEILALFNSTTALEKLAAIASQRNQPACLAFAKVSNAACATLSSVTLQATMCTIRFYTQIATTVTSDVMLCMAISAVSNVRCAQFTGNIGTTSMHLTIRSVLTSSGAICKLHMSAANARWFTLAGVDRNSLRNPAQLLSEFNCCGERRSRITRDAEILDLAMLVGMMAAAANDDESDDDLPPLEPSDDDFVMPNLFD